MKSWPGRPTPANRPSRWPPNPAAVCGAGPRWPGRLQLSWRVTKIWPASNSILELLTQPDRRRGGHFAIGRRHRHYECHAGLGDRADARNWHPQSRRRHQSSNSQPVHDRGQRAQPEPAACSVLLLALLTDLRFALDNQFAAAISWQISWLSTAVFHCWSA